MVVTPAPTTPAPAPAAASSAAASSAAASSAAASSGAAVWHQEEGRVLDDDDISAMEEEDDGGLLEHDSSMDEEDDDDELELFMMTVLVALKEEMREDGPSDRLLKAIEEEEKRQQLWAPRRLKDESRCRFSQVTGVHFPNDAAFRRYFRMRRDSFVKFCNSLCDTVGRDEFRPEDSLGSSSQYQGVVKMAGGVVCGEVRVAIS
jgi:hypothetical protein